MQTPAERANAYADAIEAIISGGANISYSVSGKTFTKASIEQLESLQRYWEGKAHERQYGFTTYSDLSGDQSC
jgi:hypothetical protein|tara:strand:- start:179 stop:397 length:219 start_codon:yes stop_codon:yes gene_type:complete